MTKKKDPKDKKTAGRPTVMTPEVVNKLEQAFSMGCSDLEACLFADISKQTLYDYQAKHPEFADRKAMLKETLILKARSVIATSLNNKDENTAKWYLERKRKDEFSTKVENELSGGMNILVADKKAKDTLEGL
jgi:hypothetical protein